MATMLNRLHNQNFQKIMIHGNHPKNTLKLFQSFHKRSMASSIYRTNTKPINRHKIHNRIQTCTKQHFTAQSSTNKQSETNPNHRVIRRLDYIPPPFIITDIDLDFDIFDGYTVVTNSMTIKTNPNTSHTTPQSMLFDGDTSLQLESISVNSTACDYTIHDNGALEIQIEPQFYNQNNEIPIVIQTRIKPENNTSLEGLYKSSSIYCTQCEAEGFRKITYFFDRPDVTSSYTTTIRADKDKYPILLSNGNIVESGEDDTDTTRHYVKWFDPYNKPCYLFALVAGDLEYIEDKFTTNKSAKEISLRIYTEAHNIDKCLWGMQSLKQSMKWDEDRYDLEYDLDLFNIVAVDDFNMGAMENKSLNIFNTKYVLASNDTATDTDYHNVQRVIGHEYFHNYTGNRVTCRDWFQLSLKEGLTVFRDQEFSSDLNDRGVERIDQIQLLQAAQFKEDASPMAHAVRPDEYMEINNFYTVTVYEKGAEIVRMIQTIIGRDNFKKGLNLYLSKHDGEACTIEDFVSCMQQVSGTKYLDQFLTSWYSQPGTPEVSVETEYNEEDKIYTIHLKQNNPSSKATNPYIIPLNLSLLNRKMDENHTVPYELIVNKENKSGPAVRTLLLCEPQQTFHFYNIEHEPLLSINRNFSAPVYIQHPVAMQDLNILAVKDSDPFNRWSAANKLLSISIIKNYTENKAQSELNGLVKDTFKRLLQQFVPEKVEKHFKLEQDANKRKQILRDKRREKKQQQVEHQFLLDDNDYIQDKEYAYNKAQDMSDEKFIDDLIGSKQTDAEKSLRRLKRNPLLTSRLLCLPSFNYLFGLLSDDTNANGTNPELLIDCIESLKSEIGYKLYPQLVNSYTWSRDQLAMLSLYPNFNQTYDGWVKGRNYRSLLNICLHYMVSYHEDKSYKQLQQSSQILFEQYQLSRNMTEMFGALSALLNSNRVDIQNEKDEILQHFYRHFEDDKLVVQKWLRLQSAANGDKNIMSTMNNLLNHSCYDSSNPNFIYSLIGGFAFANIKGFHQKSGSGYRFIADQVLYYDKLNSSVASRLCKAYENANKLDENRQHIIQSELERILRNESLSKGTYEIAHKIVSSIQK